jgi:hypothetical protein
MPSRYNLHGCIISALERFTPLGLESPRRTYVCDVGQNTVLLSDISIPSKFPMYTNLLYMPSRYKLHSCIISALKRFTPFSSESPRRTYYCDVGWKYHPLRGHTALQSCALLERCKNHKQRWEQLSLSFLLRGDFLCSMSRAGILSPPIFCVYRGDSHWFQVQYDGIEPQAHV